MCYLYDFMKCFVRNDEIKLWNQSIKYLAMYSKTNVKGGSQEDGMGQLLHLLLNIRE